MINRSLPNFGALLAPGLKKVWYEKYMRYPTYYQDVFNMNTSDRAFEEWTGVTGVIGLAQEKPEGTAIVYADPAVLTPKRVTMTTFGLGMRITMEAQQDNLYQPLKKLSGQLGEAFQIRKETDGANVLNLGFATAGVSVTGHDGKALFDTGHPIKGGSYGATRASTPNLTTVPAKTTLTASNRLATDSDLDYVSFQDSITLIRRTANEQGNYIQMTPKTLWVPPELAFIAEELFKSATRPDTANRADNVIRNFVDVQVWPYLLDSDAWFVQCQDHDLQWFDRMPMAVQNKDANDGTWDELMEGVMRYGFGFHDWRGWVGTPGA
jgi:hypothetical protein